MTDFAAIDFETAIWKIIITHYAMQKLALLSH